MKDPDHWHASPLAGGPTRNRTLLAFHRGRVRRRRRHGCMAAVPYGALLAALAMRALPASRPLARILKLDPPATPPLGASPADHSRVNTL